MMLYIDIPKHYFIIPIPAIRAIYTFENGQGMVFKDGADENSDENLHPLIQKVVVKQQKPNLKLVK